jgi:hypothetical protein
MEYCQSTPALGINFRWRLLATPIALHQNGTISDPAEARAGND